VRFRYFYQKRNVMAKAKKGKGRKVVKYILILGLITFVIMQFFRIDKTNPKVEKAKDFITLAQPPADVEKMLRTACYDCHSNETKYPWYSNVAPVSWWLKDHIDEGREYFNFSTWADISVEDQNHLLHECEEEVEEKEMPLASYTWTHGDADLSDQQRKTLATWFESRMTAEDTE
jgi:hypothetical protein